LKNKYGPQYVLHASKELAAAMRHIAKQPNQNSKKLRRRENSCKLQMHVYIETNHPKGWNECQIIG